MSDTKTRKPRAPRSKKVVEAPPAPTRKGVPTVRKSEPPVHVHTDPHDIAKAPNYFPDGVFELEPFGDHDWSDGTDLTWQPMSPKAYDKLNEEHEGARMFSMRAMMYLYFNMAPMHTGHLAFLCQRDAILFRSVMYENWINSDKGIEELTANAGSVTEVARRAGSVALRTIPLAMQDVSFAIFAVSLRVANVDAVEAGICASGATPIAHTAIEHRIDINAVWDAREELALAAYDYFAEHFAKNRGEVAFRAVDITGQPFDDTFVNTFSKAHNLPADVTANILAGSAMRLARLGLPIYAVSDRADPKIPWKGAPGAPGFRLELEEEIGEAYWRLRGEVVATNAWGVGLGGEA